VKNFIKETFYRTNNRAQNCFASAEYPGHIFAQGNGRYNHYQRDKYDAQAITNSHGNLLFAAPAFQLNVKLSAKFYDQKILSDKSAKHVALKVALQ